MSLERQPTEPWSDAQFLDAAKKALGLTWAQMADLCTTNGLSPADVRAILKGISGSVDAKFTAKAKDLEHWRKRGHRSDRCAHPHVFSIRVGIDYNSSLSEKRIVPADPAISEVNNAAAKAWTDKKDKEAAQLEEAAGGRIEETPGWEFSADLLRKHLEQFLEQAGQQPTSPTEGDGSDGT
jgi:hypothetical protein